MKHNWILYMTSSSGCGMLGGVAQSAWSLNIEDGLFLGIGLTLIVVSFLAMIEHRKR